MDAIEEPNRQNDITRMLSNEKCKRESTKAHLKMKRLAIISFMKKNLTLVFQIIKNCHCSDLECFVCLVVVNLYLEIKSLIKENLIE